KRPLNNSDEKTNCTIIPPTQQAASEAPSKRLKPDSIACTAVILQCPITGKKEPGPAVIFKGKVAEPNQRSWKRIYAERLVVERNWRRSKYEIRELKGHTDGVMCLQFDDCNGTLVTGSYDSTVRVWDVETGECLKVLTGHTRCVRGLQFDDNKLVSGSIDRTIRIWSMKTFECIRVMEGHTDAVVCVNFDDKLLASGSADGTIRVWNIGAGKCFVIRAHNDWVNKVAIYEKTKLFSCSDDHTIKLWNLETKELIRSFMGHTQQVQSLQISVPHRRDPRASMESKGLEPRLVTGSLDSTVKVWKIDTGECVRTLFGHKEGVWAVSSDTLRIVSGAHDRNVCVWDMESGQAMYSIQEDRGTINCCQLSDTKIISGNEEGTIRIYDFSDRSV
ncbi:hypothetical protein HDV05_008600, partial [Chytridiales sp. JEL 0842]